MICIPTNEKCSNSDIYASMYKICISIIFFLFDVSQIRLFDLNKKVKLYWQTILNYIAKRKSSNIGPGLYWKEVNIRDRPLFLFEGNGLPVE